MATVKSNTAVNYTPVSEQETTVNVELPISNAPTADDKNFTAGLLAAIGGIVGCIGCCMIFGLSLSLVIPILKLVIGRHYRDRCPIQPKIPVFLYVGGIAGIVATLVPLVGSVMSCIQGFKSIAKEEANKSDTVKRSPLIRIVGIVTILLNLFLFIWLICGAVWTLGVYNRVSYDAQNETNYCHRTLYRFAVVLLILGFLQVLAQCCCGGFGTRRKNPK